MTRSKIGGRRPPKFELIAGNVSLDFVNTLDDRPSEKPKELLADYGELLRFGEDAEILKPEQLHPLQEHADRAPGEAEDALRRARDLREALHEIFSAVTNKRPASHLAIDRLNRSLHEAALHSRLTQRGRRLEWRFDDMTSSFSAMLWPIARAAADVLASDELALVRACSSPTCRWLFLDTSKNHHRRWCSMKSCGNRAKVRKFYARKRNRAAQNS